MSTKPITEQAKPPTRATRSRGLSGGLATLNAYQRDRAAQARSRGFAGPAAGTEIARLVIDAARDDSRLAADLAAVVAPHIRPEPPAEAGWMTTREAAAHLGLTLHALHRLTAARAVPFEQDAPGGKCWFNRTDLDAWRRGSGSGSSATASKSLPNRSNRFH
jgi:excisionase family DNA binding protein